MNWVTWSKNSQHGRKLVNMVKPFTPINSPPPLGCNRCTYTVYTVFTHVFKGCFRKLNVDRFERIPIHVNRFPIHVSHSLIHVDHAINYLESD